MTDKQVLEPPFYEPLLWAELVAMAQGRRGVVEPLYEALADQMRLVERLMALSAERALVQRDIENTPREDMWEMSVAFTLRDALDSEIEVSLAKIEETISTLKDLKEKMSRGGRKASEERNKNAEPLFAAIRTAMEEFYRDSGNAFPKRWENPIRQHLKKALPKKWQGAMKDISSYRLDVLRREIAGLPPAKSARKKNM